MRPLFHRVVAILLTVASYAAAQSPLQSLPRKTPESQGVSSKAILEFVRAADESVKSLHSFMLLRHGNVVAEAWWSPEAHDRPHVLWSLSKSFTSTAVGLAVADGKLSIDDQVLSFFSDAVPAEPSENLRRMRVRDLLRMATGHQTEPPRTEKEPWTKTFLSHPVPFKPGTHFQYNTSATYMLSAIVQKVTGQKVSEYLQPRLFEPLGISPPRWDESPAGISIGGYGLYLCTEDIAKFGQLYLQRGKWGNQQLLPATWVDEATGFRVSNGSNPESDWDQGYGYQFWQCRHDAYRGDGKDGQFCIVLPKLDAVVVMTAKSRDLQAQLNLVWEYLLPGFHKQPLPEDTVTQQTLQRVTSLLKVTASD